MNKLDLCPLQESYSVKYGTSVERIALRGGFGRYIQTKNAKKHLVDVSFTLRENDFIYFRAFYLNWQLNPLPFLMSLIIEDSEFREYIAQFVPDSFNFNELNGNVFSVSTQLVVLITEVKILTSKPYQIEHVEELSASFDINQATLKESPFAYEDLQSSFLVNDAHLRDIFASYTSDDEKLSANFTVSAAKFISSEPSNKSYTAEVESLRVSTFAVNNAVQKTLLFSNTMEVHNMTTAFTVNNAKITNV